MGGIERMNGYPLLAGCVALFGAALFSACSPHGETFLNHAPDAKYVGLESCSNCHLEIATSYRQTGMGRSWYRMTTEVAVESWNENNEFVIPGSGLRYRMSERDGAYYMRQFMTDSRGEEFAADERELVWVIGSNNHARIYVTESDGRLFQAPICWYEEVSRWGLCPGFEHQQSYFSRGIDEDCVFCHNARMEPLAGERFTFRKPYPQGIDCERCHGPGSLHVEKWTSHAAKRTGDADPTIVNPRRLPPDRRIELCSQCHLGDLNAKTRVARHDRSMWDFRPGQPLTELTVPFRYTDPPEHEFSIASQADRLILSRCYEESGGRLECLTCHNPHVTVYHSERPADSFRRQCLGCHTEEACAHDGAARRSTEGLEDDCVACHMRRGHPDEHPFTTMTDHWIRRTIVTDPNRPHATEIGPAFPEQFASFSPADQAFYHGKAAYQFLWSTPGDPSSERLREVEHLLQTAIELGSATPEAWFMLGDVLALQGRIDDAESAFGEALDRNAEHRNASFELGRHLGNRGKLDESLEVFRAMTIRDARDAGALSELGRLRLGRGDVKGAIDLFSRAIEAEPWTALLYLNRGIALARLGSLEAATKDATQAIRLAPEDPNAWELYARMMMAVGRPEQAAEGVRIHRRLTAVVSGRGDRPGHP